MNHRLLPDEVVALILKKADQYKLRDYCNYALINKQFNKAANARIWETLYLLEQDYVARLLPSINNSPRLLGHHVQLIRLKNVRMDDTSFLRLMTHVPNVDILELHNVDGVTDTSFQQIPHHIPHLTSLSLDQRHITHLSIEALAQHCHQLRSLSLNNVTLSSRTFAALAACPLLIDLSFSVDDLPKDPSDAVASSTILDLIALTSLKYILIRDVTPWFCRAVAATVHSLIWPQLIHLTIRGNALDDACAMALLNHLLSPKLKQVFLNDSHFLTDRTLDTITTLISDIERVSLDDCEHITHHGVRRMALGCRLLRCIYLYNCGIDATLCFPNLLHVRDCRYDKTPPHYLHLLGPQSLAAIRRGYDLDRINDSNKR
ncbi:hypothetical protein BCR42DRAFT_425417 [Absidia repens]|uniref:F-box domain-containing protein n=1 Tax=Absidia repens TaxID=90262 RepID=A0A1X2I2U7_9FUNG|nr:hypothetical protein BCR42DRAFT_425417 [Absidia repens]